MCSDFTGKDIPCGGDRPHDGEPFRAGLRRRVERGRTQGRWTGRGRVGRPLQRGGRDVHGPEILQRPGRLTAWWVMVPMHSHETFGIMFSNEQKTQIEAEIEALLEWEQ